jgi:DNA invertase Pin-like site-specific DNA recombinase
MLGIYVRTSKEDDKKESPIEQQKSLGIQFALENKYQYEVYEDKGISGFKIADDDNDPFKNCPRFTDLINDIKAKKIDKVWVWEHSRLSRNQYASAIIFNLFEKQNIKIFEKDKEFNLKDPQTKLFRGILDVMAEYERSLIVGRTTRGLHNKINQGKRSFGSLYGYKKAGLDSKGFQILDKVDSEMENLKYGYKRILEGATLRQLTLELYNSQSFDKNEALRVSRYWHKLLTHFSYTGYELNMAGLEIKKKFDNFEIDDLSIINNEQYYVPSQHYPHKIISIENWVKVAEKLRINRQGHHNNKSNKASRDLATGIITCSECGQKYYSFTQVSKKCGHTYYYDYYKHNVAMQNVIKKKKKKSFIVNNADNIFKLFFFYYYMVFDNTNELLQESQRLIMTNQMKLEEQISQYEKNEKLYKNQIKKFNLALDDTDNMGEIKILARRISETEENIKTNYENLVKVKIELEQLREQYAGTEAMNAFYNVKDRINDFFTKNIEEQRDNLLAIIKKCLVFSPYLLIDTGKIIFIFDTEQKHEFKNDLLNNLDKDKIYKEHFIEALTTDKPFIDIMDLDREYYIKNKIYKVGETPIFECRLNGQNKPFNKLLAENIFQKLRIDYAFSKHTNILFFLNFS